MFVQFIINRLKIWLDIVRIGYNDKDIIVSVTVNEAAADKKTKQIFKHLKCIEVLSLP